MNKLKSNKSDGNLDFDSDHLLNWTPKLVTILSVFFNAMMIHGHNVNDLLFSTTVITELFAMFLNSRTFATVTLMRN